MSIAAKPLPKNYRLLLEIVDEGGAGCHLTLSEIYEKARTRRPGIGFTTVYRGLARLRDRGLISELHLPGADAAAYEPAGTPHAHFRCTHCAAIEDVPFAMPADTLAGLAQHHGFAITGEHVTFEGLCARCRSASSSPPTA